MSYLTGETLLEAAFQSAVSDKDYPYVIFVRKGAGNNWKKIVLPCGSNGCETFESVMHELQLLLTNYVGTYELNSILNTAQFHLTIRKRGQCLFIVEL